MRDRKSLFHSDTRFGSLHILRLRLHTASPVVCTHILIALHYVAVYVGKTEIFRTSLVPACLRFQYPVADRLIHIISCHRSRLEIIIDDIISRVVITAVNGTVPPVVEHIIHKIEVAIHSDGRIARDIRSKEIAGEKRVVTTY